MLINSLKCYSKCIGSTAFDYNLYSFGGTRRRWYASGKKSGNDDPQSFEWRCECPRDTMPMNSDPYRIKVPEIAVPPLPVSKAKDFKYFAEANYNDGNQNFAQPWYKNTILKPLTQDNDSVPGTAGQSMMVVQAKLGYHGRSKYKYAFHEPWNPLDRLSLIAQAEKDEQENRTEIAAVEKTEKESYI